MKKILLFALIATTSLSFAEGFKKIRPKAQKVTDKIAVVDAKKSTVNWTGTKVTGSHTGEVKVKSGKLIFKSGDLVGGEVVMDMTSITNSDVESMEWRKKLVDHLKSDDFFSTAKHPTAKLIVKSSKLGKGGKYNVLADLTIKGVTKKVLLDVTFNKKGPVYSGSTTFKFNRVNYGIKYKSGQFFKNLGDKLIHDDVTVKVNFTAK